MDPTLEIARTTRFATVTHVVGCASTQDLAGADSTPGWAIYWADHQSRGRGREGRTWHDSPAENLAVTFRVTDVRFDSPTHLAAAIPVAVIRSLDDVLSEARIKWPNDILVGGRKLCGVLIDSQADIHLIGVGMNINRSDFPEQLRETSTSLALQTGHPFDRGVRLLRLAQAIDQVIDSLQRGAQTEIAAAFTRHLDLLGRRVAATTGGETTAGTLTALDLDRIVLDATTEIPLAHLRRLAAL